MLILSKSKYPVRVRSLAVTPVCPTWHDDIREAQFPGDGHTPSEEDHVLSPQLLDIPVEELERHGHAWQESNKKMSNQKYIFRSWLRRCPCLFAPLSCNKRLQIDHDPPPNTRNNLILQQH